MAANFAGGSPHVSLGKGVDRAVVTGNLFSGQLRFRLILGRMCRSNVTPRLLKFKRIFAGVTHRMFACACEFGACDAWHLLSALASFCPLKLQDSTSGWQESARNLSRSDRAPNRSVVLIEIEIKICA
jgi:hypothetical protein